MRENFLYRVLILAFLLLAAGLFYTQILRYGSYSKMSKNNSIRIIPIDAPRGNIYDRNGVALVSSRLSFDVSVLYQEIADMKKVTRLFKDVLGMSGREITEALEKAARKPFVPVRIIEDIDKDKAISLEEEAADCRGIFIETGSKRSYIYNFSGGHIFGYLSEITEQELDNLRDYGYRSRDMVGRDGIEKYYDSYLRGTDGGIQVEVDNRGQQTRVLGLKEPSAGKDLQLCIDVSLQSVCDSLLGDRPGAIVVINPSTGEVLALATHPSYDPNIFVKPNTSKQRLALLNDRTGRPLFNRAISGQYPPGSIFKIVVAAAALELRKINAHTSFSCTGSYKLGRRVFKCWKEEGHGAQSVKQALMNSCNVFFYNTGRLVGVDALEAYSKLFGLGKRTAIDLPDEAKGIVPGKSWKRSKMNAAWYEGETVNYAIGQGYLLITPIQAVVMTSVIANSGQIVKPYLVKRVGLKTINVEGPKPLGLRPDTVKMVRRGMFEVINNESGTGKRARIEGVLIAGKTGTAQNPQGKTHAWFVGFGPYDNPKICVSVFLEHGGKGGIGPAEIAHGIFETAKSKGYL